MGRLLVFGLLFLIPRLATACSCGSIASGCDRSWIPKETAFLGRVTAMERTRESGFLSSYAARFVVDENFSGAAAGSEVTVYTGMGGGDWVSVVLERKLALRGNDLFYVGVATSTRLNFPLRTAFWPPWFRRDPTGGRYKSQCFRYWGLKVKCNSGSRTLVKWLVLPEIAFATC